jgi:hypothetical protein
MTKPTTPLRQRIIEDMAIRNMSPVTQAAYVRAVDVPNSVELEAAVAAQSSRYSG